MTCLQVRRALSLPCSSNLGWWGPPRAGRASAAATGRCPKRLAGQRCPERVGSTRALRSPCLATPPCLQPRGVWMVTLLETKRSLTWQRCGSTSEARHTSVCPFECCVARQLGAGSCLLAGAAGCLCNRLTARPPLRVPPFLRRRLTFAKGTKDAMSRRWDEGCIQSAVIHIIQRCSGRAVRRRCVVPAHGSKGGGRGGGAAGCVCASARSTCRPRCHRCCCYQLCCRRRCCRSSRAVPNAAVAGCCAALMPLVPRSLLISTAAYPQLVIVSFCSSSPSGYVFFPQRQHRRLRGAGPAAGGGQSQVQQAAEPRQEAAERVGGQGAGLRRQPGRGAERQSSGAPAHRLECCGALRTPPPRLGTCTLCVLLD